MKEKTKDIGHFLKHYNAEQLYWAAEFGRSKRKISVDELKQNLHLIDRPVFFLSTGRTGTQWFAHLFSSIKGIKAYHAPAPDLASQNCFAYRIQKEAQQSKDLDNEILKHIFLAGREQYLRYSYKCQRRYLETNNHITFFAHSIADMLPQAKFIHIHRHPGDFVSSGLKRQWYQEDGSTIRQIEPATPESKVPWAGLNLIQKIGWLWNETNEFIEDFKSSVPKERVSTFNFSEMTVDSLGELIEFSEANVSESKVKRLMKKKLNSQHFTSSEKYESWNSKDKQDLAEICSPLASRYGYML